MTSEPTKKQIDFDCLLDAECRAEDKIHRILTELETETGLAVAWAKIEPRNGMAVTVSLKARGDSTP